MTPADLMRVQARMLEAQAAALRLGASTYETMDALARLCKRLEVINETEWLEIIYHYDETVHRCPPSGSGTTPCCGKTPFELSQTDRMTLDEKLVTCPGSNNVQ